MFHSCGVFARTGSRPGLALDSENAETGYPTEIAIVARDYAEPVGECRRRDPEIVAADDVAAAG